MSTEKPVNIGIVGCGFMGLTHIKAYRKIERARIAAICDAYRLPPDGDFSGIGGNIGDADTVRLDMSKVKGYTDYRRLIADPDIDVVDVCVHTELHPEVAIAALDAGKNVLCEKPMARTAALARQMVDAAQRSRGFLMPAMCIRFWPEYAWLRQTVADATYGRTLAARFRRVSEPPGWSQNVFLDGARSGGALLDLHIHDADFVQFCFGRPTAVYAAGYSKNSGAIDHVVAQYQVGSGAIVHTEGTWAMSPGFGFNMAYTANFERATADFDIARGADALRLFVQGEPPRTIRCEGIDGYVGELQYMVECAASGRTPTLVTATDGMHAVALCEAEEQSIRTGQPVAVA